MSITIGPPFSFRAAMWCTAGLARPAAHAPPCSPSSRRTCPVMPSTSAASSTPRDRLCPEVIVHLEHARRAGRRRGAGGGHRLVMPRAKRQRPPLRFPRSTTSNPSSVTPAGVRSAPQGRPRRLARRGISLTFS
jgi:hypothetical protein